MAASCRSRTSLQSSSLTAVLPDYANLAAVRRGEAALGRGGAERVLEVADVNALVRQYSHKGVLTCVLNNWACAPQNSVVGHCAANSACTKGFLLVF